MKPERLPGERNVDLASVRSLKQEVLFSLAAKALPIRRRAGTATRVAVATTAADAEGFLPALGIADRAGDYRLAVRVFEATPEARSAVDRIVRMARGEVSVRWVGRVLPHRSIRCRPLVLGASLSHFRVSGGTLGGVMLDRASTASGQLVLSTNHVLADENRGRIGDPILQPGTADQGTLPHDEIGRLERFVPLRPSGNLVDAAVARLSPEIEVADLALPGLGVLRSVRREGDLLGATVYKLGRTTGLTRGCVTAVELDGLRVEFEQGVLVFDDQFEVVSNDAMPFSLGGDSGALIVDEALGATGLLFAGNEQGVTYANPISAVLEALAVRFAGMRSFSVG